MIVSHKYKIIFIHIYKNAGSYFKEFLKRIDPRCSDTGGHIRAFKAKKQLKPEVWNEYKKIVIIRNSWDWQMSLLFFMKGAKSHHQHNIVKDMTINEYLEWRKSDIHQQLEFIMDEEGKECIVDKIIRYDHLYDDTVAFFQEYCNLDISDKLPEKRVNASKRDQDYRVYYDEEGKKMLEEMHKPDIDYFGFDF